MQPFPDPGRPGTTAIGSKVLTVHPRYVWVVGVVLLVGACGSPQAIEDEVAQETAQEYEDECRRYVDQMISYFGIEPIDELELGRLGDNYEGAGPGGASSFIYRYGHFTVLGSDGQEGSGGCWWRSTGYGPSPETGPMYLDTVVLHWDDHEMQCDTNWPEDTWSMMIDFRWTETPSLIAPSTTSSRLIFPYP